MQRKTVSLGIRQQHFPKTWLHINYLSQAITLNIVKDFQYFLDSLPERNKKETNEKNQCLPSKPKENFSHAS